MMKLGYNIANLNASMLGPMKGKTVKMNHILLPWALVLNELLHIFELAHKLGVVVS